MSGETPPQPDGVYYQCFRCGTIHFMPRSGPYTPPPPRFCDHDKGGCGRVDEPKKDGTAFTLVPTTLMVKLIREIKAADGLDKVVVPDDEKDFKWLTPAILADQTLRDRVAALVKEHDDPNATPPPVPEMPAEPEKVLKERFGEIFVNDLIEEHRVSCGGCRGKAKIAARDTAVQCIAKYFFTPKNEFEEREGKLIIARARGRFLVERGEHLPALKDAMDILHVKDDALKMLILLSCLTTAIEKPRRIRMPILAIGKSQFGKSHVEKIFGQLIPGGYEGKKEDRDAGYWMARQSISPKALYYMGKENPGLLSNRILFIDELGDLNDDTLELLKELTSYDMDRMVHGTVINHKYCELVLEGLPTLLTNTAEFTLEPAQMEQAFNRWFLANVDESEETTNAIAKYQADMDMFGSVTERNYEVIETARAIIHLIMRKKEFDVRVPYSDLINLTIPNMRINRQKFLDLIRAFTYLHWPVRPCVDGIYFSTFDDLELALEIWGQIEGYTFGQVDEVGFRILRTLSYTDYIGTTKIQENCKGFTSPMTVKRRLLRMEESGLVMRQERVRQVIVVDEENPRADKVWYEDIWKALVDPLHIYREDDGSIVLATPEGTPISKTKVKLEDFLVRIPTPSQGGSENQPIPTNTKNGDIGLKTFTPLETRMIDTIYNIIYNNNNNNNRVSEKVNEKKGRAEAIVLSHFRNRGIGPKANIGGHGSQGGYTTPTFQKTEPDAKTGDWGRLVLPPPDSAKVTANAIPVSAEPLQTDVCTKPTEPVKVTPSPQHVSQDALQKGLQTDDRQVVDGIMRALKEEPLGATEVRMKLSLAYQIPTTKEQVNRLLERLMSDDRLNFRDGKYVIYER